MIAAPHPRIAGLRQHPRHLRGIGPFARREQQRQAGFGYIAVLFRAQSLPCPTATGRRPMA
ncbi:hypothetical protein ACFSTD_14300 [Novosphingobium colocasiae]